MPTEREQAMLDRIASISAEIAADQAEQWRLGAVAPELIAALRPFNIDVPAGKENEVFRVTCGGWHLKAVRAALIKAEALHLADSALALARKEM